MTQQYTQADLLSQMPGIQDEGEHALNFHSLVYKSPELKVQNDGSEFMTKPSVQVLFSNKMGRFARLNYREITFGNLNNLLNCLIEMGYIRHKDGTEVKLEEIVAMDMPQKVDFVNSCAKSSKKTMIINARLEVGNKGEYMSYDIGEQEWEKTPAPQPEQAPLPEEPAELTDEQPF